MNPSTHLPPSTKPFVSRRVIALLVATLLLHWIALQSTGWTEWSANQQPSAEKITHIQLHKAQEESPTTLAPAPKQATPIAKAARKPKPPAPPMPETDAEMPAASEAPTEVADTTSAANKDDLDGKVQEDAASATAAAEANANLPPAPAPPRYAVRPLESVKIDMALVRIKPGENDTYGVASITWEVKDGRYGMQIEAGVDLVFTSINLYQLSSEGRLDSFGIAPEKSTETRRTRSSTATHFNRDDKTISFSASNKTVAMNEGAQDRATFVMQLASIGYADETQIFPGQKIELQVAEDKDATLFYFEVIAKEDIDTKLGKISAWHLMRAPRPGSYNSKLDIWLAPAFGWYPVQIRNTEKNGTVTEQTAIKMTQKDKIGS